MKQMIVFLVFLSVAAYALEAPAYDSRNSKKPCTREQAMRAEADVDRLKSWSLLYKSYKHFSHCDDGAIGEGYSDAVGKLLADRWEEFSKFTELARVDHGFQQFVIKHVDETIPADTLQKISENATSNCPSAEKRLCNLIASKASAK